MRLTFKLMIPGINPPSKGAGGCSLFYNKYFCSFENKTSPLPPFKGGIVQVFLAFWIIFLFIFLFLNISCTAQKAYIFTSFHEPADKGLRLLYSYDGFNWTDLDTTFLKPKIGTQKVMRDPSMVQGPDGTFHLVWTSSWKGDYGFGYASSKDLINWSEQKHIEIMAYDTSTVNVWAPEIFYDDDGKQFIIVWASTIPYKFPKGIENERNNHRLYYITTNDFVTFSEARLYLDPGFSVIDAVVVKRGKEDYVLIHKDNTRPMRNMKISFGKTLIGPFTKSSEPFTENFTEGPSVVKVGNEWLIYYDSYRKGIYGCAKTSDFINFEDITTKVNIPKGHKHGTIVVVDKKFVEKLINYFNKPEAKSPFEGGRGM
jgi:hypothetical protein